MPVSSRPLRLSLQTKVMAAVLTLLVVLPAITLWVLDISVTRQTKEDAGQDLTTARVVVVQSLGNRADSLVARYRNVVSDSRFQNVVRLADANTMRSHLRDLLEEFSDDTELLVFVTPDGKFFSGARRDVSLPLEEFAREAAGQVRVALAGEFGSGSLVLGERVLNVVAVPVVVTERGLAGVLVAGAGLTEATLQQIKPPETEIVLIGHEAVLVSTLKAPAAKAAVLEWAQAGDAAGPAARGASEYQGGAASTANTSSPWPGSMGTRSRRPGSTSSCSRPMSSG